MVKKLLSLGVIVLTLPMMSGCEYLSLKNEIKSLKEEIAVLEEENVGLQKRIENMSVTEEVIDSSLSVVDNTPMFNLKEDGKLVFPNKLIVPNSKSDANNSIIRVGTTFTYKPSDNWVYRLKGGTLELTHPMKIWGTVKAISTEEIVPEDQLKDILQPFFKDFPKTKISYRKIFMDEVAVGMLATADIPVNNKKHVVNVGFISIGDYGQLYLFNFEEVDKVTQQELVNLFITSCSIGDVKFTLE